MAAAIDGRSTKNAIYKAYNDLLKKVTEDKKEDRKQDKIEQEELVLVKKAGDNSEESIHKNITDIKLSISKELDTIQEKMTIESKKLSELHQAIEIEKRNLNEIYEITVNADSLAALLAANKDKKEIFENEMEEKQQAFEKEMAEKKAVWKKEQEKSELTLKEHRERLEIERKMEEEQYKYNVQRERKIDEGIYENNKSKQEKDLLEIKQNTEKELSEREKAIAEKENKFKELTERVDSFPAELETAIKETDLKVKSTIEIKYKHEAELMTKEIAGERTLHKQMVSSLEAKIQEKDAQIAKLNELADSSGKQAQDIAIKAIEGASRPKVIMDSRYEKADDRERTGKRD